MSPLIVFPLALVAAFAMGVAELLLRLSRRDGSPYAIAVDFVLGCLMIYFFASIASPLEALGRFFVFAMALSIARAAGNHHGVRIRRSSEAPRDA